MASTGQPAARPGVYQSGRIARSAGDLGLVLPAGVYECPNGDYVWPRCSQKSRGKANVVILKAQRVLVV